MRNTTQGVWTGNVHGEMMAPPPSHISHCALSGAMSGECFSAMQMSRRGMLQSVSYINAIAIFMNTKKHGKLIVLEM